MEELSFRAACLARPRESLAVAAEELGRSGGDRRLELLQGVAAACGVLQPPAHEEDPDDVARQVRKEEKSSSFFFFRALLPFLSFLLSRRRRRRLTGLWLSCCASHVVAFSLRLSCRWRTRRSWPV